MANPDLARRIATDRHLVGNHSTYHARLTLLSDDGVRADVSGAGTTIAELTGADPRPWFRCPFGDGYDDPRVLDVLSGLRYRNVHWHVVCQDWEPWRSAPEIAKAVAVGTAAHGDGTVVLLHTWPGGTADAVPQVLADLTSAGVSFVTVDELEHLP
jgi:peptidoglycan-N-acetylmuramic acid deacetylase